MQALLNIALLLLLLLASPVSCKDVLRGGLAPTPTPDPTPRKVALHNGHFHRPGIRDSCASGYVKCAPAGATEEMIPSIGPQLQNLYIAVLDSIQSVKVRSVEKDVTKRSSAHMCCVDGTQCLLLESFNVPFCWDRFTTNFFLPFSSYGNIMSGNYTSPTHFDSPPNTPSTVNLISGNYSRPDGSRGNIYGNDESFKPDTTTLGSLMPTPWTSTGVGSAIPASLLGGIATWTTTIPGTTISESVMSGATVPGTTVPARTSVVTGAASKSTNGAAVQGGGGSEYGVILNVLVAVAPLLYEGGLML